MNELVPFAQEMLAKHGEFYPFGRSMSVDGEIAYDAGDTGEEHPPSQEIIDLLVGGLREQAQRGEIRAAVVCIDVRTIPPGQTAKTDAIKACLEHSNGEAVDVFLPYRKGWLGAYKYGELFAAKGESTIFESREGS